MLTPATTDFSSHNAEVASVWNAFEARKPIRVPVMVWTNLRVTMNHPVNRSGITWEEVFTDPEKMARRQIEHQYWVRHFLPQDREMGMPERWHFDTDFQNVYEAAWFGCPVVYDGSLTPDTKPILTDENKADFLKKPIPDPFDGPFLERVWRFHELFQKWEAEGREFGGEDWGFDPRPIETGVLSGIGTDGPMTVACNIRGATEFCIDLLEDPAFADDLLAKITEATIVRLKAFRKRLGLPAKTEGFSFADDSIAMISTDTVRERLGPCYRRLIDELSNGGPGFVHLCGDATRHFPMLHREFNIWTFDTGFPVDFGWLRRELGPDVLIQGGPPVPFLKEATPDQVRQRVKEILESGIMEGGRFILREGNNLPPGVPMENLWAMYEAGVEFGHYPEAVA